MAKKFSELLIDKSQADKITPLMIAQNIMDAVKSGEVKNIIAVMENDDNQIHYVNNTMPYPRAVGLMEMGKDKLIEDAYEF
ncbi:hypothetical protein ACFP7A_01280 [Sporolactobacillus kofuensis]|uniref:Uncharacterized protein n=1 Tax=Sporolactobacillus kofuensis TaxID=269672 RepID=A0ABW1WD61_9BACL|nr:hypothetical protein [Sporolactobacillus kofuensis]MCO7177029.1 hypothetical protein [Sporolactobacillus kofuensis]